MAKPTPRRVYVDLVGDQFHLAHAELLERAAALGEALVVGVHSDADAAAIGLDPVDDAAERAALVRANRSVAEVVVDAPLVVDQAFLEAHAIDLVALADDHGDPRRREVFEVLEVGGRGVRLPWDERAAVESRLERVSARTVGARLDRIDAQLKTLSAQGEASLEGLGALAAARFADPGLTRAKRPEVDAWSEAVRSAFDEHRALATPARHGAAGARPWITRTAAWAAPGRRIALLGDHAESTAWALAHSHQVTVVHAGISPGVPQADPRFLPPGASPPRVIGCAWTDLARALPPCDTLVVTDSAAAHWLLRRKELLWQLCEQVEDTLILEVKLSPTERSFVRSRDGAFYCSDAWARAALHFVRFMEVVNLLTVVDGLPRTTGACRQRVSRFTRRKNIAHVGKVRFLDDQPAERIAAPIGTPITRVYLARKRILSDADLAFARGERGEP